MGQTINVSDGTTGGNSYTLQSTGSNNVLFINNNGAAAGPTSATFTLNTPGNYNTMSVLATGGNGGASVTATFYYEGGGTASAFSVGDWFNGTTNLAYTTSGRISGWNATAGTNNYSNLTDNPANPRLYYYDFTGLPTNLGKLEQVTFTNNTSGNHGIAFFGVSGSTAANSAVYWTGSTNNVWSLASSDTNWTGGSAYTDGSSVVFDNTGSNSGINVASTVQPSVVGFSNGAVSYSFSGAAISGSATVNLSPLAGSVTFNNANTYTGAAANSACDWKTTCTLPKIRPNSSHRRVPHWKTHLGMLRVLSVLVTSE